MPGTMLRRGCTPLPPDLRPSPCRQGFEPISPPPGSTANSSSCPAYYGTAAGRAEPLGKMKELPEVVEGSSEEEEVDRELVEKKVKQALLGSVPLGFPSAIARCSQGLGALPDARGDWGHCWTLIVTGALLGACEDQRHCQVLMGPGSVTGCSWGPGALPDARRDQGHCSVLAGTGGVAGCLRELGALLGAHGV